MFVPTYMFVIALVVLLLLCAVSAWFEVRGETTCANITWFSAMVIMLVTALCAVNNNVVLGAPQFNVQQEVQDV